MKKILCLIFLLLFSFPSTTNAQEFSSSIGVIYRVNRDGITNVSYDIEIENLVTDKYTQELSLLLQGVHPEQISAYESEKSIPTSLEDIDGVKKLTVSFPDAVVGKGKKRAFTIRFQDKTLVARAGEVWEVTLPQMKNIDTFDDFRSQLVVPVELGNLAYVSPTPKEQYIDNSFYFFSFDRKAYEKGAISAAFGEFQVFSFNLVYHLENPIPKDTVVEVAIPPDTAFQKVMYQSISPRPSKVHSDSDGNWIAEYSLSPRQKVEVNVSGFVQIYATPREFNTNNGINTSDYTTATKYWESDDPIIKSAAENLNTPKDIYDYVVNALSYDYGRAVPNVQRVGAKQALLNPKSAICMEFTDLFIALARAKGIPAREVNGYAYAENSSIQPLSLVADVLHAWPEYWDDNKRVWIPVDPTWGDTSNLDYFSKLDLRHFTFVVHGKDSEKPYPPGSYKLGPNPQKDVYVSFSKLPDNRLPKLTTALGKPKGIHLNTSGYKALVANDGPVAVYNQRISVLFDDKEVYSETIPVLYPFDKKQIPVNVNFGVLGEKAPYKISIVAGDAVAHSEVDKTKVIITRVTLLFIILFSAVAALFYKIIKK